MTDDLDLRAQFYRRNPLELLIALEGSLREGLVYIMVANRKVSVEYEHEDFRAQVTAPTLLTALALLTAKIKDSDGFNRRA